MKALTFAEAESWGSRHGLLVEVAGWRRPQIREGELPHDFDIPKDAGARVALCKFLFEPLRDDTLLIWYDDWSVWPSDEWLPMFDRFRQAFGVTERLKDRPAYLFEPTEYDDALSFFIWAAIFLWNCHVVSARQGNCLFLSHDEFGCSKFPVGGWSEGARMRLTIEGRSL
jgi:hypothetical protein